MAQFLKKNSTEQKGIVKKDKIMEKKNIRIFVKIKKQKISICVAKLRN